MNLPFALNPALESLPVYQPDRPIEEVAREWACRPPHASRWRPMKTRSALPRRRWRPSNAPPGISTSTGRQRLLF